MPPLPITSRLGMSELSVLMWVTLGEKFNYHPSLHSHGPTQPSWSMTDIWSREKESGKERERNKDRQNRELLVNKWRECECETVWETEEKKAEMNGEKKGDAEYKDAFPRKHILTFTNQPICPWWRSERYGRHIPETRLLEAVWFYETSNKILNKWLCSSCSAALKEFHLKACKSFYIFNFT